MTLFELSAQYLQFMELIENGEIPAEAIADTFEALDGEIEIKIDNTACVIKQLLAEAVAIKEQETALRERRTQKEKAAENLKALLTDNMQRIGKNKLDTARNLVSFRKSTSVKIEDEAGFMKAFPQFCNVKTEVSINKKELTDRLKAGEEINGASLEVKQNLQLK